LPTEAAHGLSHNQAPRACPTASPTASLPRHPQVPRAPPVQAVAATGGEAAGKEVGAGCALLVRLGGGAGLRKRKEGTRFRCITARKVKFVNSCLVRPALVGSVKWKILSERKMIWKQVLFPPPLPRCWALYLTCAGGCGRAGSGALSRARLGYPSAISISISSQQSCLGFDAPRGPRSAVG
jgi:hypothetical protein